MFFPYFFRILVLPSAALTTLLANAQVPMPAEQAELIDTYCTKCHNEEDWAGSLDLNLLNRGDVAADAATWEKVMRKFRGNMMPPKGNERPDPAQKAEFVSWLQGSLDSAILAHPNPGK